MVNKKTNPRVRQIFARVSEDTYQKIKKTAEKYGYSTSGFVRFCIQHTIEELAKTEE